MDLSELLQPPSPDDILAQVARIELGGEAFVLPVLPINERIRWEEGLAARLRVALDQLESLDDITAILGIFEGEEAALVEALAAYDRGGLLGGPQAIGDRARTMDLIFGVFRCWRAGHPLADIAALLARLAMHGTAFGLTSPPSPTGISTPTSSGTAGATNASSRSSTPPPTGSPRSTRRRSGRTARDTSSPTTRSNGSAGAPASTSRVRP